MKKMLITLLLALSAATGVFAQDGLGICVGYRRFNAPLFLNNTMDGISLGADYTAEKILGPIDLGFGLNFDRMWHRYGLLVPELAIAQDRTIAGWDMQIPLFFGYTVNCPGFDLYFNMGPTLSLGLQLTDRETMGKESFNLYSYTNNIHGVVYRRFDCLLGGTVGFLIGRCIRLSATVEWGSVNRVKDNGIVLDNGQVYKYDIYKDLDPSNSHNLQISATVAYRFD